MIIDRFDPENGSTDRNTNSNWTLDHSRRTVCRDEQTIELTDAEFDLLAYLAQRAGQVVGREELFNNLLNIEYDGLCRTIDIRVARLRRKLGDNGRRPRILKSVRAEGYLLIPDDHQSCDSR